MSGIVTFILLKIFAGLTTSWWWLIPIAIFNMIVNSAADAYCDDPTIEVFK